MAKNGKTQSKTPYIPIVSERLNALFNDCEGPPKPEMSPLSDTQLLESSFIALNELYRRAKSGKDESTDYIFRLAVHTTQLLDKLANNPSPILLHLARSSPLWPVMASPKPAVLKEIRKDMERLGVASNCQLDFTSRSRWSSEGPARNYAHKIFLFVQDCKTAELAHKNGFPKVPVVERVEPKLRDLFTAACALPPLSKSKAKLWMDKVGWPVILLMTEDHPETHPQLRILGTHRASHNSKPGSKTSESNIRDGIKKLITQALRSMAKHP